MAAAWQENEHHMASPVPGLLGLPLAINNPHLTKNEHGEAEGRIERKLPLLDRDYAERPIRHAVRNFIAMLYYCTDKKHKAIEFWEMVVREDPKNLNAMKDLSTAYSRLRDKNKSAEWRSRLATLKQKISGDEETMVNARCLAEQAYAFCWDIQTNVTKSVETMKKNVERYKLALQHAGNLISKEEKEDWYLGIGQAYERLAHVHFRSPTKRKNLKYTEYLQCIDKAGIYLHFCLTSSDNKLHTTEAWVVMGNALTRPKTFKPEFIPDFLQENYREEWHDPTLCYVKALSLDPDNAWILGRCGHQYFLTQRYQDAITVLDKSIGIDESVSNWFAYEVRSKVYNALSRKESNPDIKRQYLLKAEKDAEFSESHTVRTWSQQTQGEIAHSLSRCSVSSEEESHYTRKALDMFSRSFEIQTSSTVCDVHLKHGRFLLDQDRWSAIQSFKMAYSTSTSTDFSKMIAKLHLLPSMLYEYKSQGHPENLRADLAFWILDANASSELDLFAVLAKFVPKRENQTAIVEVMEYMVDNRLNQDADRMITNGFETLLKVRYMKSNFNKLRALQRKHRANMAAQPHITAPSQRVNHTFKSPATARNPSCRYDFYIISAENSKCWVIYSLLPAMGCDFFSLKGYFSSENTPLGVSPLQSQEEPIKESAYILIILTKAFLESTECEHLFEMACIVKESAQMALLVHDEVQIPVKMGGLKPFYFHCSVSEYQWFELAKFLLRNVQ